MSRHLNVYSEGGDLCLGNFMIIGGRDIEATVVEYRPPGIVDNDGFGADVSGAVCLRGYCVKRSPTDGAVSYRTEAVSLPWRSSKSGARTTKFDNMGKLCPNVNNGTMPTKKHPFGCFFRAF